MKLNPSQKTLIASQVLHTIADHTLRIGQAMEFNEIVLDMVNRVQHFVALDVKDQDHVVVCSLVILVNLEVIELNDTLYSLKK
jgi:hypothetical protein